MITKNQTLKQGKLQHKQIVSNANAGTGTGSQGEPIASKIEGLSIEGEIDNDSDGMQIGVIPIVDLGGIDSPGRTHDHKASRKKD